MQIKDEPTLGVMAVVAASFLWGTTGTAASFTLDVSPLATGAFAMGVAGILLVLRSFRTLREDLPRLRDNLPLLCVGGLSVAAYPLAFYSSMRLSGVAIGTVISIASAPLFTVLLEKIINRKPIASKWVWSFCIGSLGVILLSVGKQSGSIQYSDSPYQLYGILLGILAALSYAVYSWSARELIVKGVGSSSAVSAQFGIAAFILLPSLYLTGENLFAGVQNTVVAIYMATVPMFLGYLAFGYALKKIEASMVTLITLLEPAVAVVFAVLIVGERFNLLALIGILLISVALLIQIIKPNLVFGVLNSRG
ncbi:EamA family transporter [Vibrio hannami]|uniref:DMT family transporter n=1 Tax=Vibrio hannami TaxID=2717094 RepID=UPI00240EAFF6|nr:EamA family transporter [Vibrio hannami]MDG3084877.1 EamA family transporter [Vibrio hannami]